MWRLSGCSEGRRALVAAVHESGQELGQVQGKGTGGGGSVGLILKAAAAMAEATWGHPPRCSDDDDDDSDAGADAAQDAWPANADAPREVKWVE